MFAPDLDPAGLARSPHIIAIAGQKGGIGKSTTAICLATVALERGQRVLLVDADPQGTVSTWADVARESGRPTPDVVVLGATMHRTGELDALAAAYDLVVIDCPPRQGDVQRSAMMACNTVVFPCGPTAADAWALTASLELVQEAMSLRPDLRARLLITRKIGRTAVGKSVRALLESSGVEVLRAELGLRVAYQEAIAAGRGVTNHAPRDASAREIKDLYEELETVRHGQEARPRLAAQTAVA